MVQYDDYEQIAGKNKNIYKTFELNFIINCSLSVADLPGLIPDSHKNKGLGIQFLQHAERCMALLYIVDTSLPEPWDAVSVLQYELMQFNNHLKERPQLVIANKMDIPESKENVDKLKEIIDLPVIPISAKLGTNVSTLLKEIRILYDKSKNEEHSSNED